MSFTGIGRIGSQRILNIGVTGNNDNYYYSSPAGDFFCTHPINYNLSFASDFDIQVNNKVITSGNADFTLLCDDFQLNNTPKYKYIFGWNAGTGENNLFEIDYVISNNALMLKFPATENGTVQNPYAIDYFNSMIVKELNINSQVPENSATIKLITKFGIGFISTYMNAPYKIENEGGIEPVLIDGSNTNYSIILNY